MNIPNEIEQKADKLINWVRIEIRKSHPEYDSDVVDDMVLAVIREAGRMIEKKEKINNIDNGNEKKSKIQSKLRCVSRERYLYYKQYIRNSIYDTGM